MARKPSTQHVFGPQAFPTRTVRFDRRRLAHVDNVAQQDSAQNAFNKLARTFAAQVEALTLMHAARVRVAIDPTLAPALPLAA